MLVLLSYCCFVFAPWRREDVISSVQHASHEMHSTTRLRLNLTLAQLETPCHLCLQSLHKSQTKPLKAAVWRSACASPPSASVSASACTRLRTRCCACVLCDRLTRHGRGFGDPRCQRAGSRQRDSRGRDPTQGEVGQ